MNFLEVLQQNEDLLFNPSNDKELYSVKYKNLGVDWSNPTTRMARGLIVDKNGEIVARPFPKFFNMNELEKRDNQEIQHLSAPENLPFEVTEKRDGSLMIVFSYKGELRFASSGSIDSEHAKEFKKFAYENLTDSQIADLTKAAETYTIMFEYTAPDNVIVLHYDITEIKMIGMIETATGRDLSHAEMCELLPTIPAVNLLPIHNLKDVESYIATQQGIEGVVIRFSNGKRLKLKTEEYFMLHKYVGVLDSREPMSEKNYLTVLQYIKDDKEGDLDDLLSSLTYRYAPQEFFESIESMRQKIIKALKVYDEFTQNPQEYLDMLDVPTLYQKDGTEIINGVTRHFLVHFAKLLGAFHRIQKEYFEFAPLLKKYKKRENLKEGLRLAYGNAMNYQSLISARSFAFKQFNIYDYLESAYEIIIADLPL